MKMATICGRTRNSRKKKYSNIGMAEHVRKCSECRAILKSYGWEPPERLPAMFRLMYGEPLDMPDGIPSHLDAFAYDMAEGVYGDGPDGAFWAMYESMGGTY